MKNVKGPKKQPIKAVNTSLFTVPELTYNPLTNSDQSNVQNVQVANNKNSSFHEKDGTNQLSLQAATDNTESQEELISAEVVDCSFLLNKEDLRGIVYIS